MANDTEREAPQNDLQEEVARRAARRAKADKEREHSVWFGLGMFGLVGWSVAIPTLLGIAVGIYLDTHYPTQFSWTLMLLFVGLAIGCLNAWYWVQQERHRG